MKKMTVEMPPVSQCSVTECAYNVNQGCHAKAITVGDDRAAECDTYFVSSAHTRESSRTAGVGACKVTGCKFNDDFECTAQEISVGVAATAVNCLTYAPRQRAVA